MRTKSYYEQKTPEIVLDAEKKKIQYQLRKKEDLDSAVEDPSQSDGVLEDPVDL